MFFFKTSTNLSTESLSERIKTKPLTELSLLSVLV